MKSKTHTFLHNVLTGNCYQCGKGQVHPIHQTMLLTVAQADEMILAASKPANGAIEDCSVFANRVLYFFETGEIGLVSRTTGAVVIFKSAEEAEGQL